METKLDEFNDKFKNDVAKFSGNYMEFVVIVKDPHGGIFWKSSDVNWAVGAMTRYLNGLYERDRLQEEENFLAEAD